MSTQEDDSVWSKDIEDAFEEALNIYPPCGRRKIILSDEGKMYGRNELIARYIKLRTGKSRSRKQVSSHIQVLARKKQRELSTKLKSCDEGTRKTALENLAAMSSAQIVSATMGMSKEESQAEAQHNMNNNYHQGHQNDRYWDDGRGHPPPHQQHLQHYEDYNNGYGYAPQHDNHHHHHHHQQQQQQPPMRSYQRFERIYMVDFCAYAETIWEDNRRDRHAIVHINGPECFRQPDMECVDIWQIADKFPGLSDLFTRGPKESFYLVKIWADLPQLNHQPNYMLSSLYEGPELLNLRVTNKVFSFGKDVVEKILYPENPYFDNRTQNYVYNFSPKPLCEYLVTFMDKLNALGDVSLMNSVLENLSVLQIVSDTITNNVVFCCAYVFEIGSGSTGSQHHIYNLIDNASHPPQPPQPSQHRAGPQGSHLPPPQHGGSHPPPYNNGDSNTNGRLK